MGQLQYRRCFSIISVFICDYEEQVIITGVKAGQFVPFVKFHPENERIWKETGHRTHEATADVKYDTRRLETFDKTDDNSVHGIKNLAWNQDLVNIHETMMMGVLHQ